MEDLVLDRLGGPRVPVLRGDVARPRVVLALLLLEVQAEVDAELRAPQVDRGVEAMQLGQLFDAYVGSLRLRAKPGSMAQARVHLNHLSIHFGTSRDATTLRLADLDGFTAVRLAEPVSKGCVNGSLGFLRAALRHGVEAELLERMPCRVKKLRTIKKLPHILMPAQVERLLEVASTPIDLMILLALKAGLRHQEILHLRREDVVSGAIRITARDGWSPKNHQEREVPVSPRLAQRVASHLAELEGSWLFPCPGGGAPLYNATRQVRAAMRAAGLYARGQGLHSLRRTWATNLLGVTDMETVRQLGGWADLTTVQRYCTTTDERKHDAIQALDDESPRSLERRL